MRRISAPLVCAVFALVFLGGCMGQQDPDSFTDDVRADFVESCVDQAEADAEVDGATVISEPQEFCECAADAIDEQIEFGDLKDLNSELRNETGPLSEEVRAAYETCGPLT